MKRSIGLACVLTLITAGSAFGKPIELKLGLWLPERSPAVSKGYAPWIKEVNKAANGKIRLNWFRGLALGNTRTLYDNVLNGVADVGMIVISLRPRKHAKTNLLVLPTIADGVSSVKGSIAFWRTYESGVFDHEYDQIQPIMIHRLPPMVIWSTKELRKFEDFKGLKVRLSKQPEIFQALGMVPVKLPITDAYPGLQRGIVQATFSPWAGALSFKLHEVTKFQVETGMGTAVILLAVNSKKFATLPAESRKLLLTMGGVAFSRKMGAIFDRMEKVGMGITRKSGGTRITITGAEFDRQRAAMKPVVERIIKAVPGGDKAIAIFRAELAKLEKKR